MLYFTLFVPLSYTNSFFSSSGILNVCGLYCDTSQSHILVLKKKNPWIPLSFTRVHSLVPICIKYIMKNAEINVLKLNISTLLAHDADIFFYVWGTPSVIVQRVDKKVWRSGRVADCNPVGRRFAPRMLLLKLSCSVELVRHLWKISEKFDIYSKIFFRDVGNFFRHLCELVLRHQMRVSNYFVNSFYSVDDLFHNTAIFMAMVHWVIL